MTWILLSVPLLIFAIILYFKRVPHGWVQFRSGVILKCFPALDSKPPVKLRDAVEKLVAKKAARLNLPVARVEDFKIPTRHEEIDARIYRDSSEVADRTIVFIHGGGWCICSINTHDEPARRIAKTTKFPVISINYSLSPEYKFPRAFEECVDAIKWIHQNASTMNISDQLVVMGDSAGGNLAISATIDLIKNGFKKIVAQVVPIYPATDGRAMSTESHQLFGKGYYLTRKAMVAFTEAHLAHESDKFDPRISPILEKDLSDFPPSFILTAAFDPLRDEGEAFAQRLKDAGVPVKVKRYENAIHGFFGLKDFGSRGLEAVNDIAEYLGSTKKI